MAGDSKKLQPIIVKRVKKGGHGAHGGAWKIAYADFVTAMMAFFLLMWLLGSTTEGDRKGIADYFQSPLKVALLNSGQGSGDSSSLVRGGGNDLTRTSGQVKQGDIEAKRSTINLQALKEEAQRAEKARLQALQTKMQAAIAANPRLAALQHEIAQILGEVPNRLTLEGHTDAAPFSGGERGYSNWELSSDRANASRRELLAGGLAEERVLRVQGLASSSPYDRGDALNPANRRISIIVMNREAEDRLLRSELPTASAVPDIAPALGTVLPPSQR
jgi:chemotaxis protein MotB